jgi:phospholipase C
VAFAYRTHDALFELDPGESKTWRLPPMTPGHIVLGSFYAMPPDWTPGTIERSTPARGPRGVGVGGPIGEPVVGTGDDEIGRERDESRVPADGLEVRDDLGGSYGPTLELTLELLRGGQVVAADLNHIHHETPNAGDIWGLRVSRRLDGSIDQRRYRLEAQYPSTLPVETRRVPLRFFNRGFEENWNSNPYLEWAYLEGNVFSYQWNVEFATLYGLPTDNQHVILGHDWIKLPRVTFGTPTLLAGGDADPNPVPAIPGEIRPERTYLGLRIDATYEDSREVVFDPPGPGHADVTLPDPLSFELRLYLTPIGGGEIGYSPRVSSPLLDMLDFNVAYLTLSGSSETVNIKTLLKERLENAIYQLQNRPTGNGFDRHFRPFVVGRYEVEDVAYDRAADDMVVSYVGRRPAVEGALIAGLAMATGHEVSQPEDPRLFNTPEELPAPSSLPERTPLRSGDRGALAKIEHIVVLMQENRSFDQVLGYLSRDGLMPRNQLLTPPPVEDEQREVLQDYVDGLLPGDNDRDKIAYPEGSNQFYRSRRTTTTAWPSFELDNPCHGHACVERQLDDNMKGFIADYARRTQKPEELQLIMDYLTDVELPVFGLLTREFAICDHWHCSHIGGTLPNRFITLTGDLSQDVYGSPEVENPDLTDAFAPSEAETFFEALTARGVTWKLFEHGYGFTRLMRKYTFDETNLVGFKNPDDGFVKTALDGNLPQVSFIEPDYIELPKGNDDHAPADMASGQQLIATIVDALIRSPQWGTTLLIITYDEHGGFYDHMPLPYEIEYETAGTVTRVPNPPLANGERRLGVRVPTFAVSPFIEPMKQGKVNVSKTIYDHTSIPATILRTFCYPFTPSLGARTNYAADLRELLSLDTARPRSDFDGLQAEMQQILSRPAPVLNGTIPAAPLRKPAVGDLEDDFKGLVAFASSITGVGLH